MKFCPYCGAGLDEDMVFCPKCGKRFASEKENPHYTQTPAAEVKPAPVQAEAAMAAPAPKKKRGGLIAVIACVVVLAIVGGLFASGAFAPKEPEPTPEPVIPFPDDTAAIAAASESVVMLTCYDRNGDPYATGSGFAIFEDGVIVTNYHVISEEVYRVKAETESGRSFECQTVLAWDEERDIAILKADRKTELALLMPGDSENLKKGEKVVAIGSPLGLINSVSTGVFSGYIDDKVGKMLQFTAAISHGSSGGALFNDAGEVIGITFASLTAGQSLNLAVPMAEVQYLYEGASPARALSMEEFYDTFDHTPPIPTYTVGEFLKSYKKLVGQTIYIEGYVSSVLWGIDLVDSPNEILGIKVPDEKHDVYGMMDTYPEWVRKEEPRVKNYQCIEIRPGWPDWPDWEQYAIGVEPDIGDKLMVLCQIEIKDRNESGSRLEGGWQIVYTIFDIATVE